MLNGAELPLIFLNKKNYQRKQRNEQTNKQFSILIYASEETQIQF